MTWGSRAWFAFLLVTLVSTAWLDGNLKGKVVRDAQMNDAQELVLREGDFITQMQLAGASDEPR
jgi:hypothetical protein